MPWKVIEKAGTFCVFKLGADNEPMGEAIHCHATHDEAAAQARALYASEAKAAVKFSNADETDIEGLLAPYGGCFNGKDITGEFFSAKTNFALDFFPLDARPVLYHHGLDPKTGIAVVGRMKSVSRDEMGLWMTAQLDAHNEYYGAIKELIKQGKLGLSSGSMRHLVEVNPKSGEILCWPLIEGSLTPTPANPMAEVDFATAKSHFKAIGVEMPDESFLEGLKAKLTAAQEKELSDADFAYIDSQGGRHLPMHDAAHVRNALARFDQTTFESDAAKEKARKKLMAAAQAMGIEVASPGKTVLQPKDTLTVASGSGNTTVLTIWPNAVSVKAIPWEDVRSDCNHMLSEQMANADPFSDSHGYVYVEETYTDHVIACISKDGQERYFSIPFTLGEDGHVAGMGQAEEVEETYVPVKPAMSNMPMAMHADMAKTYATSLLERTKDLQERRVKEGRMISSANRKRLGQCIGDMRKACDEMQGLIDGAEPQPAKAASARLQIELLKLYAATIN
ncbi:MAG: hypothetical protein Q7K03_08395 [Dehalococcoidia bacterium]|nr:hypothetical protein [Dehalococcoidia bacterium]